MKKDKLPKTGDQIEAMRIALALVGVAVNSQTACLLMETFKTIQVLGDSFSVHDAVMIEYDVSKRYNRKEIVATKNKKSTK